MRAATKARPYRGHALNAAAVCLSNQPAARACSTDAHPFAHPGACVDVEALLLGIEDVLDGRTIQNRDAFDAARDRLGLSAR